MEFLQGFSGTLVTIVLFIGGAVWTYSKLTANFASLEKDVHEEKRNNQDAMKTMRIDLNARIMPLEAQVRIQENQNAAITATLTSIQNQLQTLNAQGNTILQRMLNQNERGIHRGD